MAPGATRNSRDSSRFEPDEHVDVGRRPGGERVERVVAQHGAVDHRREGQQAQGEGAPLDRVGSGLHLDHEVGRGLDERVQLDAGDRLTGRLDPERLGQGAGHGQPDLGGERVRSGAGLRDGPAEQASCRRHRQQRRDAHRPGGLAGDRHPCRVATEGSDVVLHPLQRRDLVLQAEVGGAGLDVGLGEQEALGGEPVVDRHAHDAVAGERRPVVLQDRAGAVHERAAVDPDQHREARRRRRGRCSASRR